MTTRELTVDLEAVTPLFLGGANPDEPEARAASFRGALRFWWRALAAEPDLAALREREAAVFGDTRCASAVRVDVETIGRVPVQRWQDIFRVPGQGRESEAQKGLNYLGFSLSRSARGCLPPGTKLRLTLRLRRGASEEALRQVVAALWLLVNLGGLGTRARRGFGSFGATSHAQLDGLPPLALGKPSRAGLDQHLRAGLASLRALFPLREGLPTTFDYAALSPRHSTVVFVDDEWPTWQEALGRIAWRMAEFRTPLYPRLVDLRGDGVQEPVAEPERAAFGLPIQYFQRRTGDKAFLEPGQRRGPDTPDRRASPMLFKVVRLGPERHTVALTVFGMTRFLPDDWVHAGPTQIHGAVTARPLWRFLSELSTIHPLYKVAVP